MNRFTNPIIPGFYPDPSVCRVADDYYLVTSSFHYFPGIPIFHGKDLVHWTQIGHALDRPSQLDLDGVPASGGIWAPTIRYQRGIFYLAATLTRPEGDELHERSFIVTAGDPAGPWSEPCWLADAPGIDPSLFFDDGTVYYTANRVPPEGEAYRGERDIWVRELDLARMRLVGETRSIWRGAGGVYPEGAHLYKVDGYYYLLIAEGGTGHNHAVTVARSADLCGPYESCPRNPILTHRHLGLDYPIVNAGHADLVETKDGAWWMVLLASRPHGGYYRNLGRETFLAPVRWEDGWPVASPGTGRVEWTYDAPDLPETPAAREPACDQFEGASLGLCWNYLRTPRARIISLTERPGHLRLFLRPERLAERGNPSFVGRRQTQPSYTARTKMEFSPANSSEEAGLALIQNEQYHYRLVRMLADDRHVLRLIRVSGGATDVLAECIAPGDILYLKVEAREQELGFYVGRGDGGWATVAEGIDGRMLSTDVAGGFVGTYLGVYAGSNGTASANHADFDWFEYLPG